ncbi:MAG TPA: cytochrome c maturation protein CcmE [Longimicrobiales bacterium]
MAGKKGRSIGLIITALIVLGGFGYLVYGGLDNNLVYFLTPGELLAKRDTVVDKPVRLGGQVVPGSVQWDAQQLDLRFVLRDDKGTVNVHSTKAPPQMFREGQGVVVEGKLNHAGTFEATNLMVKHSNEYRAPHTGERPEEIYKTLIKQQ